MKNLILFSLLLSTSSYATDYVCGPANPRSPFQDRYTLKVYKKKIELGFLENNLREGKLEKNRNENFLQNYLQFGGEISKLRGEGYLKAYLNPTIMGAPKKSEVYLVWGGRGPIIMTKLKCLKQ